MKVERVKDLNTLKRGDLILSVDDGGYEELATVKCVDNEKMWTEGFIDKSEICETFEELKSEYDSIYIIKK